MDEIRRMRRVWVIGISGSGKTTLAAELARRLCVPHIELDAMHHGPDWAEPELEQFRADVAAVIAGECWVVDGGYQRKLGTMVPEAADTLIWLDLPFALVMGRLLRRTIGRVIGRQELWGTGNRETFRNAFLSRQSILLWALTTHRRNRQRFTVECESLGKDKTVVRLQNRGEVERFLRAA